MLTLIDGDFFLFTCTHNKKGITKTFEEVTQSADFLLNTILSKTKAAKWLGILTGVDNFRKIQNPTYKANRKGRELPPFFQELREYLKDTHGFVAFRHYEADDIVNIYKHKYGIENTTVVSPDKDVLNLTGNWYNPLKGELGTTSQEEADNAFWASMITGDNTDNIPGLQGKGKVWAEKLFTGNPEAELSHAVLTSYTSTYGEYKGITEFFNQYIMLKILDEPHPSYPIELIAPKDVENNLNFETAIDTITISNIFFNPIEMDNTKK